MITYALDSNIVTYALKGNAEIRRKMENVTATGDSLTIPHIVYFEIKRWLLEVGAKAKQIAFEQMLHDDIMLEPIDKAVWDAAAKLYVVSRKNGKPISDADLIIAAFCIANDYTLVTNNTRHFKRIDGLQLVNWKE